MEFLVGTTATVGAVTRRPVFARCRRRRRLAPIVARRCLSLRLAPADKPSWSWRWVWADLAACRSPAREYFRSQNIGALRARVANLAKRHGLTKTRRQKLAEEGISFLCSCDSSKPVAFARSHFWWNRF
jgi:hypothetical protein